MWLKHPYMDKHIDITAVESVECRPQSPSEDPQIIEFRFKSGFIDTMGFSTRAARSEYYEDIAAWIRETNYKKQKDLYGGNPYTPKYGHPLDY